jgi:deoxynucleoside triphosphate triphosphohydrolase SAMHD1
MIKIDKFNEYNDLYTYIDKYTMDALLEKNKIFKDVIYNSIETTLLSNLIIDSEIYQRLRYLNQLGICFLIFPNANNKRFEHSLGVYHLAGQIIETLIKNSEITQINNELIKIPFIKNYLSKKHSMNKEGLKFFATYKNETLFDTYLIEIIKIAGLVHDLGHGPFSHLFDLWLQNDPELESCEFLEHEARSKKLFKNILETRYFMLGDEKKVLSDFISDDAYNFICELIEPSDSTPDNFIFQIISNSKNGFDVDKLDYILRDSYYLNEQGPFNLNSIISQCKILDQKLCFPEKVSYEVYKVYRARYDLHKSYYGHKTVISIEFLILEIFKYLDKIIGIKQDLLNSSLDKFTDLNDNTILFFTKNLKLSNISDQSTNNLIYIEKINELLSDLNLRHIPKCLHIESRPINVDEINEIDDTKLIKIHSEKNNVPKNKIKIVRKTIGFLSGDKSHPLDNIFFINKKNKPITIPKDNISMCVPFTHREQITIIYKLTDNLCSK